MAKKNTKTKGVELNYFHVCDYASLSDNRANILGIIEDIKTAKIPLDVSQIFIVSHLWINKTGQYDEIIKIKSEDGREIKSLDLSFGNVAVKRNIKVARGGIIKLTNIRFSDFGSYKFELYINNEILATKNIEIIKS